MTTTDELHRLRHNVRATAQSAKRAARGLAGTRHEVRAQMLVEVLERAHRDLNNLLVDAEAGGGLYGLRASEGPESHGQRRH